MVLAEARDYYDNVFKPFLFEAYPNLFDPATVSLDHYLWVIGFAWSRAFAVKPPLVSQVRRPAPQALRPPTLDLTEKNTACRATVTTT